MKKACFVFLLLIHVLPFWAQQNTIEPTIFDKTDGLKLTNVQSAAFDNDGFIWLAGGSSDLREILGSKEKLVLQRFNGTNFDNIPLPDFEGKVTDVAQLFKRSDGKFYVRAKANNKPTLFLFDPISTQFSAISRPKGIHVNQSISPIFQFNSKLYVLIQNGVTITFYELKKDLQFSELFSFDYTDRKFDLSSAQLIFSEKHVVLSDDNIPVHAFNWDGKLLHKYTPSDFGIKELTSLSQMFMDELLLDGDDCYFFLLRNPQLFRLNLNDLSITPIHGKKLKSENLYILSENGKHIVVQRDVEELNFYDVQNQSFEKIHANTKFGDLHVQLAFSRNLSKEVWIVTEKQQLIHYSTAKKPITSVLDDQAIRALFSLDSNHVLVATQSDGWFKLNYTTHTTTPFIPNYEGIPFKPYASLKIISINNELWSNDFSSIIKLDPTTKKIFFSKNHPISCLAKRSTTQLIYGTNNFELIQYKIPTDQHETLLKTDSLAIIDLRIDKDWVIAGTDKGLLLYQFSTKKSQLITKNQTLTDPYILSVSKVNDGVFVLGTKSGRLFTFDTHTHKIKLVYTDELHAGIANVLVDDKNQWWLATFNGLVCFDPRTKEVNRYSTASGLSHNEANRYSSLKIGDLLFLGSFQGLNYFDPSQLRPKKDSAQLCLLMSEIFDEESDEFRKVYNRDLLNKQDRFIVPASQRSFKLKLGIKHGRIGANYSIKYRLNDGRWSTLDQSNTIYFSNIAQGNYTLAVQLFDFSGKSLGKSISYSIEVERFFYQKIWFYVLLICIGLILLGWYVFEQQKQQNMRKRFAVELIQQQESERARISKELHDSVGQQLTLLKKTAQNRAQYDISELANNTLEEVRTISKNLHPPLLQELGLTESIRALANGFDEETDMFFTLDLEEIDHHFNPTEALQIYRFIQEGLSNLIKHSQAKAAYIETRIDTKHQLIIVIDDNGVGIKFGAKKFSLGLTTMNERIRILNGNFNIDTLNPGTRLVAKIPVK